MEQFSDRKDGGKKSNLTDKKVIPNGKVGAFFQAEQVLRTQLT